MFALLQSSLVYHRLPEPAREGLLVAVHDLAGPPPSPRLLNRERECTYAERTRRGRGLARNDAALGLTHLQKHAALLAVLCVGQLPVDPYLKRAATVGRVLAAVLIIPLEPRDVLAQDDVGMPQLRARDERAVTVGRVASLSRPTLISFSAAATYEGESAPPALMETTTRFFCIVRNLRRVTCAAFVNIGPSPLALPV